MCGILLVGAGTWLIVSRPWERSIGLEELAPAGVEPPEVLEVE